METKTVILKVEPDRSVAGRLSAIARENRDRIRQYASVTDELRARMHSHIENGVRIGWLFADARTVLKGSEDSFENWFKNELDVGKTFVYKMMKIGAIFQRDKDDYDRRVRTGLHTEEDEEFYVVTTLMDQIEACKCGTFRDILAANGLIPAREISIESGSLIKNSMTKLWSFLLNSQTRLQKMIKANGEPDNWSESDRIATLHKLEPFVRLAATLRPNTQPRLNAPKSTLPNVSTLHNQSQSMRRIGQ